MPITLGKKYNICYDDALDPDSTDGDDMAAIISDPVTNNSIYSAGAVAFGSVGSGSQSSNVPGNQTITVGP